MLREEWKFDYTTDQLAETAQGKLRFHEERLAFWQQKRKSVMDTIRAEGLEVDEKIATAYTNPKARDWHRGAQVMVRTICKRISTSAWRSSNGTPRAGTSTTAGTSSCGRRRVRCSNSTSTTGCSSSGAATEEERAQISRFGLGSLDRCTGRTGFRGVSCPGRILHAANGVFWRFLR